jgi:hypothetical protein
VLAVCWRESQRADAGTPRSSSTTDDDDEGAGGDTHAQLTALTDAIDADGFEPRSLVTALTEALLDEPRIAERAKYALLRDAARTHTRLAAHGSALLQLGAWLHTIVDAFRSAPPATL